MKIKAEINSAVNTIYPGINKAALSCVGYLKFKLQILFGFFSFFRSFILLRVAVAEPLRS